MATLINVVHLITCALIVLVVLLQAGKGAEISASLGGSSQTVFGSSGGANFFVKLTWGLAITFALTSLGLTLSANRAQKSLFEKSPPAAEAPLAPASGAAPAAPAAAAPATPAPGKTAQ